MDKEQRIIEIILKAQDANASLKEMAAGSAVLTAQLGKMGQDDPGRAKLLADLQTMNQRLAASRAEMRQVVKSEEELATEALAAAAATEELARANQQTVATGQKATASLNEMKAAAGLLEKELAALSQDDPGRAKLQQDFATLAQRVQAASAAMRTQVQSAEQLAAAEAALSAENVRVVVDGQKVAATFNEMKAAANQLEKELGDLSQDDPGRGKLIADYRSLQQRIEAVKDEMGQAAPKANLFKEALGLAGVVVSVEAAVDGIIGLGKSVFETTAKFETYGAIMKNALGSESAAQLALHDIQTLAAQTPFSVDELTNSFIKFVNRGLKPSMEDMKKMADLAASQGKSFDQLTEAVLDAGTGEFERLKEFGIQASKSGDQVSLSFKGVQKTVANTPDAINAALVGFGELNGVMGMTDTISGTLTGQVSNLGDTADQVAIQYGTGLKPVFVAIIQTIATFLGVLGALPKFVVENRGLLLGLVVAVATLNGATVAATASTLAQLAVEKARAIATRASAAAQWLLNVAMEANPIGLVVALVALLVGGFVTLYERSEKVRAVVAGLGAAFMAFVTTLKNGVIQQLSGIGDVLVGIFTANPEKIKAGLTAIGGSLKTIYYDAGKNAGAAYSQGYHEKLAAEAAARAGKEVDGAANAAAEKKKAEAAAKARAEAEAAAHLKSLNTEQANLKVRLAQAEDGSRQEMQLKQQLIGVAAKIELADAKKTEDDKRVIRAEAQDKMQDLARDFNAKEAKERDAQRKKLQQLADEAAKKELAVEHAVQDIRVAAIKDAHMRELAEIDLQTARKKEVLKGSEEQITAEKLALDEARLVKVAELQAKWDEEAAKKKEEDAQAAAAINDAADEEYAAYLENKVANGLMAEQDYQDALYNLRKQALENQLKLLTSHGKSETAEAKAIKTALLKNETQHVNDVKKEKEKVATTDTALANLSKRLNSDGVEDLMASLGKKSIAYQAFMAAKKAMALWDIKVNLVSELSENAKQAAAFPPPFNIIYKVATDALSIAGAAGAAGKVLAFAKGGNTGKGGEALDGRQLAALLSGASGGSFAAGGEVKGPTLGLIGEAGAELVVPNWLFTDPKQANLMGYLEAQIASRGNAFADGGRTTDRGPVAPPAADEVAGSAVVDLLQQLVKSQQSFQSEISDWQRNLVVNNNLVDVQKGLKTVQSVQKGGGIR